MCVRNKVRESESERVKAHVCVYSKESEGEGEEESSIQVESGPEEQKDDVSQATRKSAIKPFCLRARYASCCNRKWCVQHMETSVRHACSLTVIAPICSLTVIGSTNTSL